MSRLACQYRYDLCLGRCAGYNDVMTDIARSVLEWTYQPKSFFEEKTTLYHADGFIEIGEGKARGEFGADRFEQGEAFCNSAHEILNAAFLAQQIQVHQPYTLGKPTLEHPPLLKADVDSAALTLIPYTERKARIRNDR